MPKVIPEVDVVKAIRDELEKSSASKQWRITERFLMAALGSIPWVGGFIAAAASIPSVESTARGNALRTKWLEEHHRKLEDLNSIFGEISQRFEKLGPSIQERIQSPEYLDLVRQAFRAWDQAETEQKRKYVANILSNSAGTRLCSDNVVRLFISWLNLYHETHFAVIAEVYRNPGTTRFEIWSDLHGELPREDSPEADLYRLLIRDLSTGGVIRQVRDTNEDGQFLRRRPIRRRGYTPTTMESAFEDSKQYVLTELGKQFVHYTMNEVVPRIENKSG